MWVLYRYLTGHIPVIYPAKKASGLATTHGEFGGGDHMSPSSAYLLLKFLNGPEEFLNSGVT